MLVTSPVRKAVLADMPELMEMCRALSAENAMFKMNEDKVADMLKRAFDGKGAIIGALGPKGKIEGAIYMYISQMWYSDEYFLEELWNHVLPQYRKSNNAKDLISFAKRCSSELGIPLVIGVVSNIRTRAKVGLYTRQLSDPVGAYFAYNMPNRDNAQKTA
jgi:hypothetical protein